MQATEKLQTNGSNLEDKNTKEHIETWFNVKKELLKVSFIERVSAVAGDMALIVFMVFFGVIAMAFAAVALGFGLSIWLESYLAGFGAVAVLYAVIVALLIWKGRVVIRETVVDWLVKEFMK